MHFTEDDFENAILELFREQLGYDYVYGPNVIRDYAEPLYVEALEAVLPQKGDKAAVVFDENGEAWLPVFWPSG